LSPHGDHQCLYRAQSDELFPGTQFPAFAWGFIKSKVYTGRIVDDLAKLRNRIIDAVQKITPQMLESVFRETIHRFELCRDTDGRHVETNKQNQIMVALILKWIVTFETNYKLRKCADLL
jgi:hypothetical protein